MRIPGRTHAYGPDRRDAVSAVRNRKDAPSKEAAYSQYQTHQQPGNAAAAYNFRPAELVPTPIGLYHSVFSTVRRILSQPTARMEIPEGRVKSAYQSLLLGLRHYETENERLGDLTKTIAFQFLGHAFWSKMMVDLGAGKECVPDGGTKTVLAVGDRNITIYIGIGELQNAFGEGGCDPTSQLEHHFQVIVSSPNYEKIRHLTCCPALLLAFAPPYLTLTGAVFADRFFFETLGQVHISPFSRDTTGQQDRWTAAAREIAKMLMALEAGLEELDAFYRTTLSTAEAMFKTPSQSGSRSRGPSRNLFTSNVPPVPQRSGIDFIHWRAFQKDGTTHRLTYPKRLTGDSNFVRLVYLAKMERNGEAPINVVVKFAETYSEKAHRLLAQKELAPELHDCAVEESLGLWAVVMEELVPKPQDADSLTREEQESLRLAIETLHKNDLVHGDLRWPNVLLTDRGVRLIDFEWAGTEGIARYPVDISLSADMGWAEGVERGGIIRKEHDIHWLTRMTSEP